MEQSHDSGIHQITARPGQQAYGMGLGVILLEDVYPGFPGDIRNASGYPFPIQYEIVNGADIKKLVVDENKIICLPPLIRAAQRLIDISIFSWGTLLDYAYSIVVHRDYYGHV
jgi:hypothetical protein